MIDFEAVMKAKSLREIDLNSISAFVTDENNPLLGDNEKNNLIKMVGGDLNNRVLCDHLGVPFGKDPRSELECMRIFAYAWFALGYDEKFRVPAFN